MSRKYPGRCQLPGCNARTVAGEDRLLCTTHHHMLPTQLRHLLWKARTSNNPVRYETMKREAIRFVQAKCPLPKQK